MWTYRAPVSDMLHLMTQVLDAPASWAALPAFDGLDADTAGQVQTIIREVQGAQVTAACVDSPAVRVALDGLRRLAEAPAARDPDAEPASLIVPMLGGAGSSGR